MTTEPEVPPLAVRPRFTVRRLMLAVAVAALILASIAPTRAFFGDGDWTVFIVRYGGPVLAALAIGSLALAVAFLVQLARPARSPLAPGPPDSE